MAQSASARIPLLVALAVPGACHAVADALHRLLDVPLGQAMAAVRAEVETDGAVPLHAPGCELTAERLLGGRLVTEARMAAALLAHVLLVLADKPFKTGGEVRYLLGIEREAAAALSIATPPFLSLSPG